MEKIIRSDRARDKVLHGVKEERNNVCTIIRRKANWIGHILRERCLLKTFIEGKIQGAGIQGRRIKHFLCDLEGNRRSCNLKEKH
jgi:hypothetical protein